MFALHLPTQRCIAPITTCRRFLFLRCLQFVSSPCTLDHCCTTVTVINRYVLVRRKRRITKGQIPLQRLPRNFTVSIFCYREVADTFYGLISDLPPTPCGRCQIGTTCMDVCKTVSSIIIIVSLLAQMTRQSIKSILHLTTIL